MYRYVRCTRERVIILGVIVFMGGYRLYFLGICFILWGCFLVMSFILNYSRVDLFNTEIPLSWYMLHPVGVLLWMSFILNYSRVDLFNTKLLTGGSL